ncbi:hypothetical protein QOZ80_7AG0563500 [Eleusine coracana subsp. coracana]|nr:hypothetical protein QOZ80_7AG0563500 [Eleusine coracana subsp. coracana]
MKGAITGGVSGIVVETALYPIDTIKTRLQAAQGGSTIQWKGLYAGLAGNIDGVLPASAVFVGVYEPAKRKVLEMFPENLSSIAHLTAGAIGEAASSIIRVPTEVVKQRMQMIQFKTAPDAVRFIVAKEGIKGLYAGYGSFLLRDLPFDAIQFCIYEQLRIGYKLVVFTQFMFAKRDNYRCFCRCNYWRFDNTPRCYEDEIDDSGTRESIQRFHRLCSNYSARGRRWCFPEGY